MVGQKTLLKTLDNLILGGIFPRFCILTGILGSDKRGIIDIVVSKLGYDKVECGIKVDELRDIIAIAYTVTKPTIYIIENADEMSLAAKNALLKVTEEPPNNAYFIMTITDLSQMLDTIKSRGTVFYMDVYTPDEILEYAKSKYTLKSTDYDIILNICETPLEVDMLVNYGISKFDDYINLVVDNIATVSGANSFKIAEKLALKSKGSSDDLPFEVDNSKYEYDLRLFFKAFMKICTDRMVDDPFRYAEGIKITSKYFQELHLKSINKQATFDMWLLAIRAEWMGDE